MLKGFQMAYATLDQAKTYSELVNLSDAQLTLLLDAATQLIDKVCYRTFGQSSYTETHSGANDTILVLRIPPINTLTEVVFKNGSEETKWDFTTTPTVGQAFLVDANAGIIHSSPDYGIVFPEGYKNIQVSYNGGYAAIPPAIVQACIALAIDLFSSTEKSSNLTGLKLGDYAEQYADSSSGDGSTGIPDSVMKMIFPFILLSNTVRGCPLNP